MKKILPLAGTLLAFILMALVLVKVYDKGKDQKPLQYADVPQETIDWINSLGEGLGDIFSTFDPTPIPTPWGNSNDPGQDPEAGLEKLEDEYFIIYHPEALSQKAQLTLQLAHEAIPRMESVVGKYYYPEDMNGRKVAIYLTQGQKDFNKLMGQFGLKRNFDNVDGITIYTISPAGLYLKGIALKGSSVFRNDDYHREVQWHEMTHYCFAASLDYSQSINLPAWCTEGIAEYTGIASRRPTFSTSEIARMRQDCHLSDAAFPLVFEVYAGGHSIFCHMEDRYREEGVKDFLQTLYHKGIPTSLQENFGTTMSAFEGDWKAHLDKFRH